MPHSELRELVLTGQSDALRAYSATIALESDRIFASEALNLMAYLGESDYSAADSYQEALRYKYSKTPVESYIEQITSMALTYIHFVYGRFDEARASANKALTINAHPVEIEENDRLALKKVLAEIAYILDDYEELKKIYEEVSNGDHQDDKQQAHYFVNMIRALYEQSRGDFKLALQISEQNIETAKRHNYVGIAHALSSDIVRARALISMAQPEKATEALGGIQREAEKFRQWPWYFLASGLTIRHLAISNQMTEALAIVRSERDLIATFTFKNSLGIFPDINELYVRYILQDEERMEVLLNRVPELILVKQLRAIHQEWQGQDLLDWIKALPDITPREKLYKLVAFADHYVDRESSAVEYAREALEVAEETHSIEFILRQYKLSHVFMKAALISPTPFTENISRLIGERIKINELNKKGALMDPLTNRELEVVKHLATGKPISSIADTLHVSMNTMKTHLRNAYRKLEVDGRDSAVKKAKELFLI